MTDLRAFSRKITRFLRQHSHKLLAFGFLSLFTFCALFSAYHFAFAKKVIPGVRMGNVNLSGLTEDKVSGLLSEKFNTDISVKFSYGSESYVVSKEDVSLSYNLKESVENAFKMGRTGNFTVDLKTKIALLIKGINLAPNYSIDQEKLNQKIAQVQGAVNIEPLEPKFSLDNSTGELSVTPFREGKEVEDGKVRNHFIYSVNTFNSAEYSLPVKVLTPSYTSEELEALRQDVNKLISNSPEVEYAERKWTYSKEEILGMLEYKKEDGKLRALINKEALNKTADRIGSEVDVEPRGEVFKEEDGRVIEFKPKTNGKKLDREKFKKDLASSLMSDSKKVSLSVVESEAPGGTNPYGIYALLGEGVSHFAGSIPGRVKNLTLAAERSSGILLAPGEVYSFNKVVGEISGKTGYDVAYIIQNGRTVLGEGGGVCQSSTTLFRAALNAGLPIIKRTAHAYRVSYYEQKSALALDATVYNPTVDFQFKNDTPGYILIQADWDLTSSMLRYRIYGTPDGRTVELTKPVISSQTPPPEPVYIDDPNLPEGKIVQTDYPSWGAVASFKRTVKKGNEVLFEDTFVSRYQAWRAIFMKGTKT